MKSVNITDIAGLFIDDKKEIEDKHKCINQKCDGYIYIIKGKEICKKCGIIYNNVIDTGAEWTNDIDNNGKDKTRCGPPINDMLPYTSYGTGFSLSDGYYNKQIYQKLNRHWQWNSEPHSEKAIKKRFDNIETKCKMYNIKQTIIERAKKIFFDINKIIEKEDNLKTRGYSNEGLQAAAVYQVFKDMKEPKSHKEIAHIFNIDSKYVSNGIKRFNSIMEKTDKYLYTSNTIEYSDYIIKYGKILNFTDELIKISNDLIIEILQKKILDNNTPIAIIAGVLYYVVTMNGIDNISKATIENICNISAVTITKICEKICESFIISSGGSGEN